MSMRLPEVTLVNGPVGRSGTWRVRTPRRSRSGRGTWQVRTPGPPTPPGSGPSRSGAEPAELVGSFARALDGKERGVQNEVMRSTGESSTDSEREHGDRQRFLAGARQRLASGIPGNRVHPMPERSVSLEGATGDEVPRPRYGIPSDDPAQREPASDDLITPFARALEEAGGTCHIVDREIPETLLDTLVAELDAWHAVVSAEPEAHSLGQRLAARGVEVSEATPGAAAAAGLGITSASAGIAATGSIVLDSSHTGGRAVSSLPPVHLCILPAERLVATPSDVLRPLAGNPAALPASLVLVTGPSRSGDIEQILTIGAHGPVEVIVILVR